MPSRYVAKPVIVTASIITEVIDNSGQAEHNGYSLKLDDGSIYNAPQELTARMVPKAGDYVVTQEDGYIYLNPKDVFERKYSALPDEPKENLAAKE